MSSDSAEKTIIAPRNSATLRHTHTRELIVIGSDVGPSSVALVHSGTQLSYAGVLHTRFTRSEDPIGIEG